MRPAQILKGCFRWSSKYLRRRRESNPCTGLCRPLPKPLGHSATEAARPTSDEAAASRLAMDSENRGLAPTVFGVSERTTGFEPATLTLAR